MNNIAFSGFMGSGKTTVARKLSKLIVPSSFIDVDRHISENVIKGPIGDLILRKGMPVFREIETQAIKDIVGSSKAGVFNILSLGGGAVTIPENVSILKQNERFKIIYLDVPFDTLAERLKSDIEGNKDRVPFDEEKFRKMYNDRLEIYNSTADIVIKNIGTVEHTVNQIISHL